MGKWKAYKIGGKDSKGRVIEEIYSHDDSHIIYATSEALQFEGDLTKLDNEPEINLRLTQIRALAPSDGESKYIHRALLANALTACMAGDISNCKQQLKNIYDSLINRKSAAARLIYLWSSFLLSAFFWLLFLVLYLYFGDVWKGIIWAQVICFSASGGVLSVAWRQQKIPVDPDKNPLMHISNGASRIVLASLSGVACYLAVKSGVVLTILEKWDSSYAVLFFCFLSGFSEKFMPNVLNSVESKV